MLSDDLFPKPTDVSTDEDGTPKREDFEATAVATLPIELCVVFVPSKDV